MLRIRLQILGVVAIFLLAGSAGAQRRRAELLPADVEKLESATRNNPLDKAARGALLEYYFFARIDPSTAISARRRLILWTIENAPDDPMAYGPFMTIDPAGHRLADPQGVRLASNAWRRQAAKPDVKPMTLANAAYFFKMTDQSYTIGLLKRALHLDAANKEIGARLGDEYALVILGVTMVNGSGYPMGSDPVRTQSAIAKQCRDELAATRNPYVLAKAGSQLLWQGDVLYHARKLPFNPEPLGKGALDRAAALAPDDHDVLALRAQYEKLLAEEKSPVVAAVPKPGTSAPGSALTADDLKKVAAGMTREQLLRLGVPAGRMTTDEDGHMVELYQYSAKGTYLGTVRLKDGVVSSVHVP